VAETRTYQPTDTEVNLRLWIVKAFAGESVDAEVIYSNQGAIRLDRPFVLLSIISEGVVQYPFEIVTDNRNVDGTYEICISEHRAGSVQVMAHGSTSWDMMSTIARSIRRSDVIEYNTENGIEIMKPLTGINDRPLQLSTQYEPRKQQDYEYAFGRTTTLSIGARVLEQAVIGGNIENQNPDELDPNFIITWP
jgi:hypothetical protein